MPRPRRQKGQAVVEKKAAALTELKIEYVPLTSIEPNDYNPNRQDENEFRLLVRSIREDGFTQPIIIAADSTIVDGEHRWRAAREAGLKTIPVVRVPMEAAQARIATLRHNRARGTEDHALSVAVLRDLEQLGALDWAAASLEIDDKELNRLLEDLPAPEALAGEEFTEAWVPGFANPEKTEDSEAARVDFTPAATAALKDQDAAVKAATTDEERQQLRWHRSVYRVALTFTGDEAEVVQGTLGDDEPAQRLLELCRIEAGEPAPESEEAVA